MKNKIAMFVFAVMIIASPVTGAWANRIPGSEQSNFVQRADVIVRKYRVSHGVLQYRRWNETRGVWVDKNWITMN